MTKRLAALMAGWTEYNKSRLLSKMNSKGIQDGGILNTYEENKALYDFLKQA